MKLVTVGTGFIGSNFDGELCARGHEPVVCDRLGAQAKWRNVVRRLPSRLTEALKPQYRYFTVLRMG